MREEDPTVTYGDLRAIPEADLRRLLEEAHVQALLVTLVSLTGDASLLAPEFEPSRVSVTLGIDPTGGLSPEVLERARAAAMAVLLRLRAAPESLEPRALDRSVLRRLMTFLTGSVDDGYLPLMEHELGLPVDAGAPSWRLHELAPGRNVRVAVIGAGMSGIVAAHRLKQAGIPHVVFERGPDVGGVWRDNTYPGARLDTSNFTYAYSFAQTAGWTDHYSPQRDVLGYLRGVVDRHGLRDSMRFDTSVAKGQFDARRGVWQLDLRGADGRTYSEEFDFVVAAVGQLSEPQIPDLPGLAEFRGPTWHTSRWDHDVDLSDKRVALLGTGASGFQVLPALAEQAKSTAVFQRTPAWVLPTPDYTRKLPVGLRWLLDNVPNYRRYYRFMQFWLNVDGIRHLAVVDPSWNAEGSVSEKNEAVRARLEGHLRAQFADRPDLAERLLPRYPPYAKRTVRDDGRWADAMKRDNVELVTSSIERVTADGIVTKDGILHAADVIVFGTGFKASQLLSHVDLRSAAGVSLAEHWNGDPRAYYGTAVPGFPNLFIVYGPNTNLNTNGSTVLFSEVTVEYALDCIRHVIENGQQTIEVSRGPHDDINARIDEASRNLAIGAAKVNSWYKNAAGRVSQNWPLTTLEFWNAMKAFQPEHFVFTEKQRP